MNMSASKEVSGSDQEVSRFNKLWGAMKQGRATTENEWQRVADKSFPKRDFTTTRTPGSSRMQRIFDGTGISSVLLLASALHGNLTPVQTKWLFLKSEENTRAYFDMATEKMLALFASPVSGFAAQAHEFYMDIVAFGNAVMAVYNKNGRLVFRTLNLDDCWFEENDFGEVDRLVYTQKYTPEQAVKRFGADKVHESVLDSYKDGDQTATCVIANLVEPRQKNLGRGAEKSQKPFRSVYIDTTNGHVLLEDGYDDFPYVVARFSKRSGETYGYGPGMSSISEVEMLNEIVEVMLRAATKNADPPILSAIEGVILPMRLDPGGINYYDPDVGPPDFWNNGFRPDYMDSLIERKRLDIQRMFFIDFLTLPDKSRMTATETMQHAQNSFRNMAAVNARLEAEFLSRLVQRVFVLMVDIGELPVPPPEIQGRDIVIEYTSPMAMAQKSIAANAVLQGLSVVSQAAQFDPSVVNIINAPNMVRDQMLNTFFMPSSYVRGEAEYEEIIEQQEQAQASAMMGQNLGQYASGAKDAADAMKTLTESEIV